MISTPTWPASWKARIRCSGIARPMWMSGEVTSMPSLTRSGRPSRSLASRPPSGSTSNALRVSSPLGTGLDYLGSARAPEEDASSEAAPHTEAATPRAARRARAARFERIRFRNAARDRVADSRAQSEPAADAEQLRLRRRRPHDPRRPARIAGTRDRALDRDLALAEARDRGDRRQALLRAPRHRPARDP